VSFEPETGPAAIPQVPAGVPAPPSPTEA